MAIATNSQTVSYRVIVIAKDRVDAMRSGEFAEHFGHAFDVLVSFVDEIAGQHGHVATLGLGKLNGLRQVSGRNALAAVQVGELNNP